jgi:hypothetical protein
MAGHWIAHHAYADKSYSRLIHIYSRWLLATEDLLVFVSVFPRALCVLAVKPN